MTNDSLKKIIKFVMENRGEINSILDYVDAAELENQVLAISEDLVNCGLRSRIMGLSPYLQDYSVLFMNEGIVLDAALNVPKIGIVKAKYLLKPIEIKYDSAGKRAYFEYQEDVKAEGTIAGVALNAFKLGGTVLQKVAGLAKNKYEIKDGVYVDSKMAAVDLDRLEMSGAGFAGGAGASFAGGAAGGAGAGFAGVAGGAAGGAGASFAMKLPEGIGVNYLGVRNSCLRLEFHLE